MYTKLPAIDCAIRRRFGIELRCRERRAVDNIRRVRPHDRRHHRAALIVNVAALEVMSPGLVTVTLAVPAVCKSDAGTVA